MTFGKRLALFFTLIVVVPTTALLGILLYVSKDSREGQSDAALAGGLTTAIAENADRTRIARERAEDLVRTPALAAALRSGRPAELQAALNSAMGPQDEAARVADSDGTVLAATGIEDAVAFGQVRITDPGAAGRSLAVSLTDAGTLASAISHLTGRDLVIFRDSTPLAGSVSPPAAPPPAGTTGEVELHGKTVRVRAVQLNREHGGAIPLEDELLVMYGPKVKGGLISLDGPVPFLLITFLLLVMTFAWAVARELSTLHDQVARQAVTDPLTGLWNRRKLDEMLELEIARAKRFDHSVSLVTIDIDRFKEVNDEHGHAAGDAVLRDVATLIDGFTRTIDHGGRVGGDELALMLPETGPVGARILAERLCTLVRERELGEDGMPITISVGVASLPESAADAASLNAAADAALYEAKRNGRDQVQSSRQIEPLRVTGSPGRRPGLRGKRSGTGRDRRGSGE